MNCMPKNTSALEKSDVNVVLQCKFYLKLLQKKIMPRIVSQVGRMHGILHLDIEQMCNIVI